MNEPAIYRSTHPDALLAWVEWEAAAQAHADAVAEFLAEQGFDPKVGRWTSGARLVGIDADGAGAIPAGWRKDASSGYLVPARRSPAQRAAADRFAQLSEYPTPSRYMDKAGMPGAALVGRWYLTPAFNRVEATVWAKWSQEPVSRNPRDQVDAERWERVPLSEFFALVESGSDPFADTFEPVTA